MRFALAGGTSPLGRDLADHLILLNHDVTIFSRHGRNPGVMGYEQLHKVKIDAIVNLIGGHQSDLDAYAMDAIMTLSQKMIETADKKQIPLVHLSSGSVLKNSVGDLPISTEDQIGPKLSKYIELKMRMEALHDLYRGSVPISDLRLFSFAGRNFLRESNYFLSNLVNTVLDGSTFRLQGPGFVRDYSGPMEVASLIALSAERKFSGQLNIHSGEATTREAIVQLFVDKFNLRLEPSNFHESIEPYFASDQGIFPEFFPRKSISVIESETEEALRESAGLE